MENHLLKLVNPQVFKGEFEKNLANHSTYKQAYEAVEEKYEAIFGQRRYSSYDSFRNSTRNKPSIEIW